MDIPEVKNKMIGDAENKAVNPPTTIKPVSPKMNEYFFPGGGRWKPMSVMAVDLTEAEELHRVKREPVNQEETKVEESKETNNE